MAARRMGLICLLLCLCLGLLSPCAHAAESIDVNRDCSLTITYRLGAEPIPGVEVELYHIADVSADFVYTLRPEFAACGLELNGVQTQGEWNVIRSSLHSYILANRLSPLRSALSDSAGQVNFTGLKPGLYLAIPAPVNHNGKICSFDSCLVALPGLDENGAWLYHVEVSAKGQETPPEDPDDPPDDPDDPDTEYTVIKLWKDNNSSRPDSIEIEIYRNGELYMVVILSEENNWSFSWTAEDDGSQWMVVERNVPYGYIVTVEQRGNCFIVTNTLVPESPPPTDPPKTGDTPHIMLYTILMYVSGLVLLLLGLTGRKKRL